MDPFESYWLGTVTLKNRVLRAATYEGMYDEQGFPTEALYQHYEALASGEAGGIISGFVYTSREGRAMHPFQGGIDHDDKIPHFQKLTERVHRHHCPVFLQISHSGRQSLAESTGSGIRGASGKRSLYFWDKPKALSTEEVYQKIEEYAEAARRAMLSGFDGVEVHAAHGYLIHQFLLPSVNTRRDEFGVDKNTGIGSLFLEKVVHAVREKCGKDFPVLVKISSGATSHGSFGSREFEALITVLDALKVTAIEVSYGTMDHPLNIFRGDFPFRLILKKNPIMNRGSIFFRMMTRVLLYTYFFPRHRPFTPVYNLDDARRARSLTSIPVISVGGFRSGEEIVEALEEGKADLVSLCRPFVAEPDFMLKFRDNRKHSSSCCNCNFCAVMCDTRHPTRCYSKSLKTESP